MSNTYASAHARESVKIKADKPGRMRWSKKKIAMVAVVAVAAIGGGTAWAAVALFGFGTLDANAATLANLSVDNASAQLTHKLVPGQTVGAKVAVTNTNDFSVTITNVIVHNETVATKPATGQCPTTVHLASGGTDVAWPGTPTGDHGTQYPVTANVVINPNETKWVEVTSVVRQDASATELCGVHADFAVKAQTAS